MNELKENQYSLIIKSMQIAKQLQRDSGEDIKRLYAEGKTHKDIALQLSIGLIYDVKKTTAINAVRLALRGYKSYFNLEPSQGLYSASELEKMAREHYQSAASRRYDNKQGIFGWDDKKLRKHFQKLGRKTYSIGVGAFAMSKEKKTLASKKGGASAAKKRGQVLWNQMGRTKETKDITEIERAYALTLQREYIHQDGRHVGMPIILNILQTINLEYHHNKPVRTKCALERALEKERKKRKKQKNINTL